MFKKGSIHVFAEGGTIEVQDGLVAIHDEESDSGAILPLCQVEEIEYHEEPDPDVE